MFKIAKSICKQSYFVVILPALFDFGDNKYDTKYILGPMTENTETYVVKMVNI